MHRQRDEQKSPYVPQDFVSFGNMWSAIPIALLCTIVNWSEGKQGSGPEGD